MQYNASDDIERIVTGEIYYILKQMVLTLNSSFDATEDIESIAYGRAVTAIKLLFANY